MFDLSDFENNKFYDRINNIETDIKKTASLIDSADDAIAFLTKIINEINNLPIGLKRKLIQLSLISIIASLPQNQINKVSELIKSKNFAGETKQIINNVIDKVINIKPKVDVSTNQLSVSDDLINFLKSEETFGGKPDLKPYDIGDGAYTIGYGHAIFKDESRGDNGGNYSFLPKYKDINLKTTRITPGQAEILLRDDVNIAAEGLNRILKQWKGEGLNIKLTQNQYDAIVSIIYNYGINNLRTSKFIQLVKRGRFNDAAEEIKNISNNMFNKYPGLKTRREREYNIFKNNKYIKK